jgi:hypothetical protein
MELMGEGKRRKGEEGEERSVYKGPNLEREEGRLAVGFVDTDVQERKRGSDVCGKRFPSQSRRERFDIWP